MFCKITINEKLSIYSSSTNFKFVMIKKSSAQSKLTIQTFQINTLNISINRVATRNAKLIQNFLSDVAL